MNKNLLAEEEDEVVGEVDLFLAQPEENCELHILQYPLRDATIGIGKDRKITGVNVRPKHGRIEVKLAVLPERPDPDEASSIGGCSKSFDMAQDLADEKAIGEEQCLRSRHNTAQPATNFGVAAYTDEEKSEDGTPYFTIVPVRAVSQLRPAFDYLDEFDAATFKQRAAEQIARAAARGIDTKQQLQREEEDASPLQVSFQRRETERAAERRKNSHATLRQKEEGEAWVPVQFAAADSEAARERRQKLFHSSRVAPAVVKAESLFDSATTYTDLFKSHTRHVRLGLVAKGNVDPETLSVGSLKQLSVAASVAQVIARARVVSFANICEVVSEGATHNEILSATRLAAVCLRGCWVAKKGSKKGFDKLRHAAERFDASRELILNEFRHERTITFEAACLAVGDRMLISDDSVRAILQEVAVHERGVGWEFRMEDDVTFMREHHELCETQQRDWDCRVKAAREKLAKTKR